MMRKLSSCLTTHSLGGCSTLYLSASAAGADNTHGKLAEGVVQFLDVGEHRAPVRAQPHALVAKMLEAVRKRC